MGVCITFADELRALIERWESLGDNRFEIIQILDRASLELEPDEPDGDGQ